MHPTKIRPINTDEDQFVQEAKKLRLVKDWIEMKLVLKQTQNLKRN
jgi:hypothetical protein